jgi:phosphate transport system permease protein
MSKRNRNRNIDRAFSYFGILCTVFGLVALAIFIFNIFSDGVGRLSAQFMNGFPSSKPEKAGILPAWTGTLWILFLTAMIAIPIGIATGIYLEQYAKASRNKMVKRLGSILEINIANLAGVPSIIYGILGLELFVRALRFEESLLAGGFTLALLILPIIIVATREAIKAVPKSIVEASYALGATKWQTIRTQILPASSGGIVTGIILSIARAVGETAPLIVIGALAYVPFVAKSPMDKFTVLPMQIFNWISRPQHGFAVNAAAAIIVLLVIVFMMNGVAIYLRNRFNRKLGK